MRRIFLGAQDTTRYGEDIDLPNGLTRLVERLLAETDFRWIRFLYAYPGSLDWSLFELMGREPRFASYVDIPLQHVSTNVLGRMRRPGSPQEYRQMISRMRELVPDITLRTTFITGHRAAARVPADVRESRDYGCASVRSRRRGRGLRYGAKLSRERRRDAACSAGEDASAPLAKASSQAERWRLAG